MRFEVIENRIGLVHNTQTFPANLQAIIDILEAVPVALIQSAELLVQRARRHETRTRDDLHVLRPPYVHVFVRHHEIMMERLRVLSAERIPDHDDAAMLALAVGIEQPRADRADVLFTCAFEHRR